MPTQYTKVFTSIGDAVRYARGGRFNQEVKWAGGLHRVEAINAYQQGRLVSQSVMQRATALLDKIDASFRDRNIDVWQPSVAGAYPIVPEWMMGRMDAMRVRRAIQDDITPIKIYIESGVSAGVSHEQLINRGVAIAALLMRMNEERPVELHTYAAWKLHTCRMHCVFWSARMDSAPINLSEVLQTLTTPTFARMINFNIADVLAVENGDTIRWGSEPLDWACSEHPKGRAEGLREHFGLNPQDILVERGYLPDAALMQSDPVAWVHAQLEKQRELDE